MTRDFGDRLLKGIHLLPECPQGGDSNIKIPKCVCLVFEHRSIVNETLSCKTYLYWKDPQQQFIPIFDGNIKVNLYISFIILDVTSIWPIFPGCVVQSKHFCLSLYIIYLKNPTHIERNSKFHTHFEWHFPIHFIHLKPKRDPYPSLFDTHIQAWLIPSRPLPPGECPPPPPGCPPPPPARPLPPSLGFIP